METIAPTTTFREVADVRSVPEAASMSDGTSMVTAGVADPQVLLSGEIDLREQTIQTEIKKMDSPRRINQHALLLTVDSRSENAPTPRMALGERNFPGEKYVYVTSKLGSRITNTRAAVLKLTRLELVEVNMEGAQTGYYIRLREDGETTQDTDATVMTDDGSRPNDKNEKSPNRQKQLFQALMGLPARPKQKEDVDTRSDRQKSIDEIKKRKRGILLNPEQIAEYKEAIGFNGIVVATSCLTIDDGKNITRSYAFKTFKGIDGDPSDIVMQAVDKDVLSYYFVELANPNSKREMAYLFCRSFNEAVDALWDLEESISGSTMHNAHEVIKRLKGKGWTQDQLKSLIARHFGDQDLSSKKPFSSPPPKFHF